MVNVTINSLNTTIDELCRYTKKRLANEPLLPFARLHVDALADNSTWSAQLNSYQTWLKNNTDKTHYPSMTKTLVEKSALPPISIVGAGTAGLLCAAILSKYGFKIELYEARTRERARLRYPNISFKEAQTLLQPMLGQALYDEFFLYGGSLDGDTGKLRVSIGSFQDVLLNYIDKQSNITTHFSEKIDITSVIKPQDRLLTILATGAHTAKRYQLDEALSMHYFESFNVYGKTALFISETQSAHGYSRKEREGYHWRRENKSVYSGQVMSADLDRVSQQLESQTTIKQLQSLKSAKSVDYNFTFGNDTEDFLTPSSYSHAPIIEGRYQVCPMFSLTPVFNTANSTIVTLGDANGTPHPLAAIGTLKFLKNMQHMVALSLRLAGIETLSQSSEKKALKKAAYSTYQTHALMNTQDVFWGNILSSLFSQPR